MQINIGKGLKLDVETAKLSGEVLDHVLAIGLRNILMDCHAGITKDKFPDDYEAKSREKAEEKLAAMYAGDIRKARASGGVSRDPVKAEALRLAAAFVRQIFAKRKDGWKIIDKDSWIAIKSHYASDFDLTNPDGMEALFDFLVDLKAEDAEVIAAAERIVEQRASAKATVNIGSLLRPA